MKQLHEGLDYTLYKIYIVGGIASYVVWVFVSTLVFDALSLPGPLPFAMIIIPLMLWVAGILLYWWWVFLFKGSRELEELVEVQEKGIPGIKSLKSWNTLHQAMAIYGGNVEELRKNAKFIVATSAGQRESHPHDITITEEAPNYSPEV